MRYHPLGTSGARASDLFLGTMTFGEDWGRGASPEACRAMFDAYAEAGGNVIDTAIVGNDVVPRHRSRANPRPHAPEEPVDP